MSGRMIVAIFAVTLVLAASAAFLEAQEPAQPAEPAPPAAPAPLAPEGYTIFQLITRGGWLMAPIILASVLGLAFIFERFIGLRHSRALPAALYDEIADLAGRGETERAEAACREGASPLSRVLRSVLLVADGTRMEMESSLENEGARVVWELRRNGKALGVIAGVAPLLGLLGTVWGMIQAFDTFARYARIQGVPPTEQLAKGINKALITTAAGLVVAIPCLLFHHYFRGRADTLVREMEDQGLELINVVTQARSRRSEGGPQR